MQPKFCTKCGNTLIQGDNFCRKCGEPIRTKGESPAGLSGPEAYNAQVVRPKVNIPGFAEVKSRLDRPGNYKQIIKNNNEETVLLGSGSAAPGMGNAVKKATIKLSFEEMLRGCSKVVDFGTGKRYELVIPSGLSPGDRIIVDNTGITDPETGTLCDFELTAVIDQN